MALNDIHTSHHARVVNLPCMVTRMNINMALNDIHTTQHARVVNLPCMVTRISNNQRNGLKEMQCSALQYNR
jgi:hypothetical protein